MLAKKWADKERYRLLLVKHTQHKTISLKLTRWCWHWSKQTKRETDYFWSNTHIHNTRPFSKTHSLILAMERAGKERNGLLLVKHTKKDHKLTSWLLAMDPEWADQERNTHWSKIHTYTQNHSINSLADASIRVSRQREKQVTSGQTYTHTQHKIIQ